MRAEEGAGEWVKSAFGLSGNEADSVNEPLGNSKVRGIDGGEVREVICYVGSLYVAQRGPPEMD